MEHHMKTFKQMAVVKYEKLLMQHLSLGGDVRDQVGKNLVGQQILAMWNKDGIQDVCAAHSITMDDFCEIYAACIERLMPNPCMNSGGGVSMLVPTLFLLEDWRIREHFTCIERMRASAPPAPRIEHYKEGMYWVARKMQEVHDASRGPVQFVIMPTGGGLPISAADPVQNRGCGCATMLLLYLALASLSLVIVFVI